MVNWRFFLFLFFTLSNVLGRAETGDQLLVNSHGPTGSVVAYSGDTNMNLGSYTEAFGGAPKIINLNQQGDQMFVSTGSGAGILSYNFNPGGVTSFTGTTVPVEGIARDSCGNVFISESNNQRIRVINSQGAEIYSMTMLSNSFPMNILFDPNGKLHVAARGRSYIPSFTIGYSGCQVTSMTQSGQVVLTGCAPAGLALDAAGNMYASCSSTGGGIRKISPTGADLGTFATVPPLNTNSAGNRGLVWHGNFLYVTNLTHNRIYKFSSSGGAPVAVLGVGELTSPQSIVVKKVTPIVTPSITLEKGAGQIFHLHIKANPNQPLKLLTKDDLADPNLEWHEVSSFQADANGNYEFVDTPNVEKRFYRLSYNFYENFAEGPPAFSTLVAPVAKSLKRKVPLSGQKGLPKSRTR